MQARHVRVNVLRVAEAVFPEPDETGSKSHRRATYRGFDGVVNAIAGASALLEMRHPDSYTHGMKRAAARGVGNRNLARVMRAVRDFCRTADAPTTAFVAETTRNPYRSVTGWRSTRCW